MHIELNKIVYVRVRVGDSCTRVVMYYFNTLFDCKVVVLEYTYVLCMYTLLVSRTQISL